MTPTLQLPAIVCPLHRYFDALRLERVTMEMKERGAPVLRGTVDGKQPIVLLCEGSHRIRAAHMLGLVPTIVSVPWWRSCAALDRARFCAARHGLRFQLVSFVAEGS